MLLKNACEMLQGKAPGIKLRAGIQGAALAHCIFDTENTSEYGKNLFDIT